VTHGGVRLRALFSDFTLISCTANKSHMAKFS
jgi:hypothetical protein